VGFQSLYATDGCGPLGSNLGATTLVFGQNAISTGTAWFSGGIDDTYNIPVITDANPQIAALQSPSFTMANFDEP
jgi:hypothetical protein